jgi:tetratricopeptide (TPR) repeat protein
VANVTQALQELINRLTPEALAGTLGVSALLLLVAFALLLTGKRPWLILCIGSVGLAAAMAVLFIVDQQTVSRRDNEVTVTRPRYWERTRMMARGAMIGLPSAVALVALSALAAARRRLRRSVPGLLKAGRTHLFLNEYEPALDRFSRAVRIAPFVSEAYYGRGAAYQGLGDAERALAEYDRAIQCDPRMVPALMRRARIRTDGGDIDGALADLSRVMDIAPTDPELYLNRGICFLKKGLKVEAAADFQRVLKLTNHSDFAEPAKEFLRQLAGCSPDAPAPAADPAPPPRANGEAESTVMPEPRTEDYIL